ncbi:DUF2125 domain-containing protein [Thalassococcus sp. CAU 1522]|uniref:DUF2125 domain-containing protein n=1 Tax=Thalassococcus arenae TaxID=2851652 RepID=A0ABS6N4G0_9RHOB|nr:DUF2125 domain-containing protein [Thalassococcus arenae]MBV2358891.1 DUF2125 domain-containing protein [Thalassococcus arenae]
MTRYSRIPALAAGLVAASPALADVTPAQVWDDLETYMQSFGYTVTATESLSGDTLTVTDVAMSIDMPDDEGTLSVAMDSITLTDLGDGTVRVAFPAVMPIAIGFVPEGEDDRVDIRLDYSQTALDMLVSGDPGALKYDYTADRIAVTLAEVRTKGVILTEEIARFVMDAGPVKGTSTVMRDTAAQKLAQDVTLGNVTYDMAFADPEGSGSFSANGQLTGLAMTSTATIPSGIDTSDPEQLFASGMAASGSVSHQGGQLAFMGNEGSDIVNGQTSSTSGSLDFVLDSEVLTYVTRGTGTTLALTVPDLPFPINAQMAESGFKISMPMAASDTPRDAALGLTLAGFTMSDMLWGIFDPAGQLPRDPATVAIDMTAQVTPFVSLMDAEAMAALEETGGVPGELNALTLNALTVEAVGGKITGDGAFTFDNEDLTSFDGMPAPEGKLNLAVSGANGLIDKLIAMGIMAEEDAMGARMMLSMFTVPGTEPDTATSVIEVNDQGHVLANGQRIK